MKALLSDQILAVVNSIPQGALTSLQIYRKSLESCYDRIFLSAAAKTTYPNVVAVTVQR